MNRLSTVGRALTKAYIGRFAFESRRSTASSLPGPMSWTTSRAASRALARWACWPTPRKPRAPRRTTSPNCAQDPAPAAGSGYPHHAPELHEANAQQPPPYSAAMGVDVTEAASSEDLAREAAEFVRARFAVRSIDLAFVLGSGWSEAADDLGAEIGRCALPEVPGCARPSVIGHGAVLRLVRTAAGKVAAIFTGRTHLYEGRGIAQVVHPIRAAAAAGARVLILTNGCGGLNPRWTAGTQVLIRDHINLTGRTPLVGPTFLDLSEVYASRLRDLARAVEPGLDEGVYVQFQGPQFETPAEVRMAGVVGGDLVGMSTALEAIAARQAGLEVLGISLITNLAAGISPTPLSHEEVLEAGQKAAQRLRTLLAGISAVL